MLETVSQGFKAAKRLLNGQSELNDKNIDNALHEVRVSLLGADVEYGVVKQFLERVKKKAVGKEVTTSIKDKSGKRHKLTPSEHFVGICQEELEALMGPAQTKLSFSKPVTTIMMVGLQGSGKTTTTGKLAHFLQKQQHKPLLVAADIYRPAAVEQLKVLGETLGIPVFADAALKPPQLCEQAIRKARELSCSVVLFDTAGRLAIDDTLMRELEDIKRLTKPDNMLLVIDAMMGQDAVQTAAEFNKRLSIDGFILTKLDGDARGGAALSIKEITGKPIKFLGMGEKLSQLEEFRPQGLASRILGMGDIVSLVKDFEEHVDQKTSEEDAKRMLKGQFTLQDFLTQLSMIKKMGPLQGLIEKIPGMSNMLPTGKNLDDKELYRFESIVHSMTQEERLKPDLIQKQRGRKQRIAKGCGKSETDVDNLLSRFQMMKKMLGNIGSHPGVFGPQAQAPMRNIPLNPINSKNKKDKRKREKLARKKNSKKRK